MCCALRNTELHVSPILRCVSCETNGKKMSRYQTLLTQMDNALISPFGVPTLSHTVNARIAKTITPLNPVPKPIPARFNPDEGPPSYTIDAQTVWGTNSNEYASLRYYGNGPY